MSIYKRDTLALVKESVNSILLQSHVLFDFLYTVRWRNR